MLQFKEQLKCRASWSLPCCALSSLPTLSLVIPCVPSFRMDGICKYSIFALHSKQLSCDNCVGPDIENCYFLAQQWHRIIEKLSLEEISGDFSSPTSVPQAGSPGASGRGPCAFMF